MALSLDEINAVTRDIIVSDGGKAFDNYSNTSAFVDRYLNQRKGLFKNLTGGHYIRVPIKFDKNTGGFIAKGDPTSSDVVETKNAARFLWKTVYGNGTILMQDEAENQGDSAIISMVEDEVMGARETCQYNLAGQVYSDATDSSEYLSGLKSMTSESSGTKYGDIAEDDLVSGDASKVWQGKTISTAQAIIQTNIRALFASAHTMDGPKGNVNFALTTLTLLNSFKDVLDPAQRLKEDEGTTKAGFSNIVFDNVTIVSDDFCPSGNMFALNDNYVGFGVMKGLNMKVEPWVKIQSPGPPGKTMKVFLMTNIICSRRAAHARHSALS